MKKRFCINIIAICLLPMTLGAVQLTPEEQAYLETLGHVTMCVDPDWEPYELVTENGDFISIAADLLEIISMRTGITPELVTTADWKESLKASKRGDGPVQEIWQQRSSYHAGPGSF